MSSKLKRGPITEEAALTLLALNGGNVRQTARELDIAHSTLIGWRDSDSERYARIQNDQAPAIAERVAARSEAVALRALDAEERLIDKTIEGIDDLKATDAAAAFRNIATGKALQFDKISNTIRGRATVRVDERDLDTIIASLGRRYGLIEGTAEEIPADAELALPSVVDHVNVRGIPVSTEPEGPSA